MISLVEAGHTSSFLGAPVDVRTTRTNSALRLLQAIGDMPLHELPGKHQVDAVRSRIVEHETAMAKIDTAEFNSSI